MPLNLYEDSKENRVLCNCCAASRGLCKNRLDTADDDAECEDCGLNVFEERIAACVEQAKAAGFEVFTSDNKLVVQKPLQIQNQTAGYDNRAEAAGL
jgi:hypothetical protein